jgi:hypothetical protein
MPRDSLTLFGIDENDDLGASLLGPINHVGVPKMRWVETPNDQSTVMHEITLGPVQVLSKTTGRIWI